MPTDHRSSRGIPLLARLDLRPGEGAALVGSVVYYFLILAAYYIMRPIRDDFGAVDSDNLALLFTGTLLGMLLLHPLYASLVARVPRRQFLAWSHRFFVLWLLGFYLLVQGGALADSVWAGRVFFVWLSVFNVFVVSLFWSFMNDLYRPRQGKRLFGMVAIGGSIGAATGSVITSRLAEHLSSSMLLLLAAALLELAVHVGRGVSNQAHALTAAAVADGDTPPPTAPEAVIGGGMFDGIRDVLRSPYLLGIAGLMLFFTVTATFIYFLQADLTRAYFGSDSAARTIFFSRRDLIVNLGTLTIQLFLTGRLVRWFGVGAALAFLPVLSMVGFLLLGLYPTLMGLMAFDVVRRIGNFGLQRPAREMLYTSLSRAEKYKAKSFNDTFVYRAGDQLGAWGYERLVALLALGMTTLSFLMVPLCAVWAGLALWLGRKERQGREGDQPVAPTH